MKHWLHMTLVVVVAFLLVTGFRMLLATWSDTTFAGSTGWSVLNWLGGSVTGSSLELGELYVGTTLLVAGPLLWFSDRRARQGLSHRPEYYMRASYRLAVYGALAVLTVLTVMQLIDVLWVLITSLSFIGVKGTDYKSLYLAEFVPALVGLVVAGGAGWYVWKLAKGRDNGAMMALVYAALGVAVAVTLFVTGAVRVHKKLSPASTMPSSSSSLPSSSGSSSSGSSDYSSPSNYGSGSSSYDSTYGQ